MLYTMEQLKKIIGASTQTLTVYLSRAEFAGCRLGEKQGLEYNKFYDLDNAQLQHLREVMNRTNKTVK